MDYPITGSETTGWDIYKIEKIRSIGNIKDILSVIGGEDEAKNSD